MIAGFWKIVIVAAVTLAVFRRMPNFRHPLWRLLRPWSSNVVRKPAPQQAAAPSQPWFHDRWFVFLLVLSSVGLTSWIVTRVLLMSSGSGAH